jgi:site-specific DNA-cytosine methylase
VRVLDLFSGLGGFSEPFRDRGHDVTTLDIDARFEADIVADVRTIRYPSLSLNGEFDVVLASPPCQCFSTLTIARYWPGGTPTPEVVEAVGLVANALRLISEVRPRFWVLENPTAMLRTVIGRPKQYVHLCDWGANWRKRTDLWGG